MIDHESLTQGLIPDYTNTVCNLNRAQILNFAFLL